MNYPTPARLRAPWDWAGSASPRSGPRPRPQKPREQAARSRPRVTPRASSAPGRWGSQPRPSGRRRWPRPHPLLEPPGRARHCGSCGPRGPAERNAASAPAGNWFGSGSGSGGVGRAAAGRWLRGVGRGRPSVRALGRRRRPGPSGRPRRPRARAQVSGFSGGCGAGRRRNGTDLREGEEVGAGRLQARGPHARRRGRGGCSAPRISARTRGPRRPALATC